jgi:hypothetical protein
MLRRHLNDTSESNPAGRLQMHVLAAVAEFERIPYFFKMIYGWLLEKGSTICCLTVR